MDPFVFTQDDHLRPTRCSGCAERIPAAMALAAGGLCPDCLRRKRESVVRHEPQAEDEAPTDQNTRYLRNTGIGSCPNCRSRNLTQYVLHEANALRNGLVAGGAALAVGGLCFWPVVLGGLALLLAARFLPACRRREVSRACVYCGHRWRL